MTKNNKAKHDQEWRELYARLKSVLQRFGEDAEAGEGDYFLIDDIVHPNAHLLEINRLHMLEPEVIEPLQRVLIGFPSWQIEIFVISAEDKTIISPESGLILRSDGIIDALDRTLLPPKYRRLQYQGSRPPSDFKH